MSTDLVLTIGGELSLDELVAALQPRFVEALRSNREPGGAVSWSGSYGNHFTCVEENWFDWNEDDPERLPLRVVFYNLHGLAEDGDDPLAARDAWCERAWAAWLPWLIEAGATEVVMAREPGPTLKRWLR